MGRKLMSVSTILTAKHGFVRSPAFLAASLALAAALPMSAVAEIQKTNPVTGETENYTWKFVGTDTWNGTQYWQNSDSAAPAGVPAKSGDSSWGGSDDQWLPILFDGNTIQINAVMSVEGWNLRMGLYNGANITLQHLVKLQSGVATWFTVDENSTLTIAGMDNNKLEGSNPLCLYSARANGITWTPALSNSAIGNGVQMPLYYYLAGDGSVAFNGGITLTSAQIIKRADVTLSEATSSKTVRSKMLVSFASSSTSTFTADATIKVKNDDGSALKDVNLTSVTATDTTLTTAGNVGDCELVQTTTGILLFYVDYAKTYKPSININFTNGAANGLTTGADVGLSGYEVPGTFWNNYVAANSTFSTVNAIDSTGAASAMSGVSVTISDTRGSYSCGSLTPSSNPLHGYIDENADNATPTVTVTGIPYYKYRVLVYHSTDTANVPFGYDTINGTNYTYVEDALSEGSTAWGNSGPENGANAIAEGGNVLVTEALSGSTLTVVGHRAGGDSSARGCIAAIQIIEVKADVGENDLEIAVAGDTQYTVEETKELTGTVYLTGSGTLTLVGENKISAATIDVGGLVTLVVNADRLDGTTFTGGGTVVYNNALPVTGKGWTDSSAWTGTVWINGKSGVTDFNVNSYGNANSAVKLSGVDGWISAPFDNTVPVILENGEFEYALKLTNGNSPNNQNPTRCTTFVKISGSGTVSDGNAANPMLKIYDGTEFTGTLTLTRAKVVFCSADSTTLPAAYTSIPNASIYVDAGNSATVASGMTWTADGGFIVDGTLNVDGTLASSQAAKAVSGSGTVVFNGKLPSPTGDAWWTNSDWDGTVQIKDAAFTGFSGVATYLEVNKYDYGNTGSVLELYNCSGWLPVGDTAGDNVCSVPLKVTGTLTINDGYSGRTFTINKLLGSGAIYTPSNPATTTIQVLSADDFTGYVNLNSKRVIFGETIPSTFTSGQIYVGSGFSFTVPNSDVAWYGTGGILLDGELKATSLSNFGGGTTITTTDNGVFTLVTNSNADDMNVDYARIQGTGTLRLEGAAYRCISTNNFPTAMTVDNRLTAGFLHRIPGLEITIGSLAGDGYLRSDWDGSAGDRDLRILQAKDTTWSGKFWTDNPHRLRSLIVAPGTTTSGTLTISATHEAAERTGLTVESGANVNITGSWVGDTTVAGTIGGTGTIDGNLTVNGGCIFAELAAEPLEPLKVTGDVTFSGAITIVYPEGTKLSDIQEIIKVTETGSMSRDNASFTVKAGSKVIGRALISGNALCTLQNQFFIRLR